MAHSKLLTRSLLRFIAIFAGVVSLAILVLLTQAWLGVMEKSSAQIADVLAPLEVTLGNVAHNVKA